MADVICRWRNPYVGTICEFVEKLPHESMPSSEFREIMEERWPGFFRTPYQLACQTGLYYESDDGTYYPRFDHDITEAEANAYMRKWITRYYVPNPYTKSLKNLESPIPFLASIVGYALQNPDSDDFHEMLEVVFQDHMGNSDIVANVLNTYSDVIRIDTEGKFSLTDKAQGFMKQYIDRNDKKAFFEHMSDGGTDEQSFGYNKLIYGAPGTSKSWTVDEKIVKGQKSFRITFHPDTDYAAFVGCYKPETIEEIEDGKVKTKIGYGFHKQVFLEAYVEAWKLLSEGKKVFLVIEEINRGNCAQIFGDIFQLLDRRKDGYSKYTINADTDISRILKDIPGYKENFIAAYPDKAADWADNLMALPTNLNIIATMNTSDQSLFQMDSAFKRRWDQEYFPIKYDDANKAVLDLGKGNVFKWGDVLLVLNDYIKQQTESANKTIGNRFIDFERTANVIAYKAFRDKVLFYLFTDVFKDSLDFAKDFYGGAFDNSHQFFEDLCENEDPAFAVAFIRKIDAKGIFAAPVVTEEDAPVEKAPETEE